MDILKLISGNPVLSKLLLGQLTDVIKKNNVGLITIEPSEKEGLEIKAYRSADVKKTVDDKTNDNEILFTLKNPL